MKNRHESLITGYNRKEAEMQKSISEHAKLAEAEQKRIDEELQNLEREKNNVEEAFKKEGELISAIIVEPIIGNGGCILPEAGFLEALRTVCDKYESLLIFDEVMTGFRVALGGAQEKYSVMPDITTLGKVIGGGFPVGAYGARKEIMELVAPAGAMYQAGTLSGNPVAMAAGLTALKKLQRAGFYDDLTAKTQYLIKGLKMASGDIPVQFVEAAGMFGMFFSKTVVKDFDEAKASNVEFFKKYSKASPLMSEFVSSKFPIFDILFK
jgi:glutamate-1-semialdehyde 2,1-aminomutase